MKRHPFPGRPWLLALCCCLALAGCAPERGELETLFVRGGLAVVNPPSGTLRVSCQGQIMLDSTRPADKASVLALAGGRWLLRFPWIPGQRYTLRTGSLERVLEAPAKPSPLLIARLNLEYLPHNDSSMRGSPDTDLCFSPDGRLLAIGSFLGYLRVVEPLTGQVLLQRKLAEGMVKRLAWGETGGRRVLFVGEQSPDGNIYCLDASSGEEIWRRRLADELGEGRPTADQWHSIYNLPGVYYLRLLSDGDLLCVATFGRFVGDDFLHDCRVYRLDGSTGRPCWLWPPQENFTAGITWAGASADGVTLAFISHNTYGRQQTDSHYREGTLYCLDGRSGRERWSHALPPLEPYYHRVGSWMAVAVSPDAKHIALGLNDGRGIVFDARDGNGPRWVKDIGTPILVGDVPVAASVGYAAATDQVVYFATSVTTIPSGQTNSRTRRPSPHPRANYLLAFDWAGAMLWQRQAPGSGQGIFVSSDGRWLATAVSQDRGRQGVDQYGLTLFDTNRPGGAQAKLLYHYPTEGPVFSQVDFSPDGLLLAITESSYSPDEGKTVHGSYRVHIIH